MSVLVTGGTGYIGAHVAHLLRVSGMDVVVADDVVSGYEDRIVGIPLERLDLSSDSAPDRLLKLIENHEVDSIIHFAARKQVGESVLKPAWYYQQNIGSLANVLIAAERGGVGRLVFSSSAAVYGEPEDEAISEDAPTVPINPYGETKLIGERLACRATESWGLRAISLRYFNVAGASRPELGDRAVLNLVPMIFEKLDSNRNPLIFGDDYKTRDGTCIRDFVHVADLAEAHIVALQALSRRPPGAAVYNVGTGKGTSVRTMMDLVADVTGIDVKPTVISRRAGDPASVVAACARIEDELGWSARYTPRDIIESAWASHQYFRAE